MASRRDSNASYSGSLQAKKKAELQEIAQALKISDAGTRDELQQRIKKHLDENTRDLEDDPAFSGLFASRRRGRSQQPTQPEINAQTQALGQYPFKTNRPSMGVIKEQREGTPGVDDLRDVSMMLSRAPVSPGSRSPSSSGPATPKSTTAFTRDVVSATTPSSLPPLPPSPAKSIIADAMAQPEVQAVVEMERSVILGAKQILVQTRSLLSSGTNLFIITALFDLMSILLTIYHDAPFPIPPVTVDVPPGLRIMSLAAIHWALPSVFLPTFLGYLISFASGHTSSNKTFSFDPLTASIVRVASNIAYQFPLVRLSDDLSDGLQSLDVLGPKWRVVTASIAMAFAFAEAVSRSGPSPARSPSQRQGSLAPAVAVVTVNQEA